VRDAEDLKAAVETAEGLGGVSVMVNNAGISRSDDFFEITESEYQELMTVNVKGPFFGSQAAAQRMVDTDRQGVIVNISNISGITGRATGVHYCTSKEAVRLMTYALAAALGPHDIRVNAVRPGVVETAMTRQDLEMFNNEATAAEICRQTAPLGRVDQPQDLANAILYLASPLSGFVTGESLIVDGGATNTWGGVASE